MQTSIVSISARKTTDGNINKMNEKIHGDAEKTQNPKKNTRWMKSSAKKPSSLINTHHTKSLVFTSIPCSATRNCTTPRWPFWAAQCKGVSPSCDHRPLPDTHTTQSHNNQWKLSIKQSRIAEKTTAHFGMFRMNVEVANRIKPQSQTIEVHYETQATFTDSPIITMLPQPNQNNAISKGSTILIKTICQQLISKHSNIQRSEKYLLRLSH